LILYVNGDSHSAGAEAVNTYCFAGDDPLYYTLGRKPHPDNERVSYGCQLANHLGAILHCDAESASSNARIIRTTREYLKTERPDFVVIGWATWEREEWLHDGVYYQVNASGTDSVPNVLQDEYKAWVVKQSTSDLINESTLQAHKDIHDFHLELQEQGIKHFFFSTLHSFANITNLEHLGGKEFDWHGCYFHPYQDNMTYHAYLTERGHKPRPVWIGPKAIREKKPIPPKSYHLNDRAHDAWAETLLPIVQNLLTK
jgi:hypothetical protein